jgi:hypothetical protein
MSLGKGISQSARLRENLFDKAFRLLYYGGYDTIRESFQAILK